MGLIVLSWAFVGFIYFKVAFQASTHEGITILASLLTAAMLAMTVFIASGVYAGKLLAYNWEPGQLRVSWGQLIAKTLMWFLLFAFGFVLASWIIIFGFSEDLSDDIEMLRWGGRLNDEFLKFVAITALPVLVHYLMCLFSTYRNANQPV
jgi:hypothetical protein